MESRVQNPKNCWTAVHQYLDYISLYLSSANGYFIHIWNICIPVCYM